MDHKIIRTKLKLKFFKVELPKNTKNQTMKFGLLFHFFGHFSTLRARISGKHSPKVKIFEIRILLIRFTQKVKNPPKKALLADFDFLQSF
jgi:hypothetical protein